MTRSVGCLGCGFCILLVCLSLYAHAERLYSSWRRSGGNWELGEALWGALWSGVDFCSTAADGAGRGGRAYLGAWCWGIFLLTTLLVLWRSVVSGLASSLGSALFYGSGGCSFFSGGEGRCAWEGRLCFLVGGVRLLLVDGLWLGCWLRASGLAQTCALLSRLLGSLWLLFADLLGAWL